MTSTVENYLKVILLRSGDAGGVASTGAISEALGVTPGTTTTMIKSLASQGLLEHHSREGVRLTENGRKVALNVVRKHRLVETFLVEVLKMDWAEVDEEAEALEHAISDRVLERIDALLGHPPVDPHGDPIPGPEGELVKQSDSITLATCAPQKPLRVVRIYDQTPEFLDFVQKAGLKPGTKLRVSRHDKTGGVVHFNLRSSGETVLGMPEAAKIEVRLMG